MDWNLQQVANGWLLSITHYSDRQAVMSRQMWIAHTPTEAATIIEDQERQHKEAGEPKAP